MYKYKEMQEFTVTVVVEVETNGRTEREQTMPILASDYMKFDFQCRFRVNSRDFKSRYRHQPLKIYLQQKPLSAKQTRAPDALLGVCKVYLGLLFVANCDSPVSGWFHVCAESSGAILGQMLVEVRTDRPISEAKTEPKRVERAVFEADWSNSTVSGICHGTRKADLDRLTEQLRQKEKSVAGREDAQEESVSVLSSLKSRLFAKH